MKFIAQLNPTHNSKYLPHTFTPQRHPDNKMMEYAVDFLVISICAFVSSSLQRLCGIIVGLLEAQRTLIKMLQQNIEQPNNGRKTFSSIYTRAAQELNWKFNYLTVLYFINSLPCLWFHPCKDIYFPSLVQGCQ